MTLTIFLFILLLIGIGYTYSIRKTPYGMLTIRAALVRRRFGDTQASDPVEFRKNMEISKRAINANPVPIEHVKDIFTSKNNIPMRVYHPSPRHELPLMIYAHGGGWVGGSLETHDNVCRRLAADSQFVVIAVDYHLAPEFPFPQPVEDMLEVLEWALENGEKYSYDTNRIVVCGDSAGGNLAAVLTNLARDQFPGIVKAQVLVYPITNVASIDTNSYKIFASSFRLTYELMDWFRKAYATADQWKDARCSPLLEENLSNLPPTLIITAAFDPLRDEGEAYGEKLKQAGNAVTISRFDGVLHGFFGNDTMGLEGLSAVREVAYFLKEYVK